MTRGEAPGTWKVDTRDTGQAGHATVQGARIVLSIRERCVSCDVHVRAQGRHTLLGHMLQKGEEEKEGHLGSVSSSTFKSGGETGGWKKRKETSSSPVSR